MAVPAQAPAVAYYVSRLIAQYRTSPKAQATIAILVKQAIADMIATAVQTAYGLETAIGAQLDILGKYVGVDRLLGPALPQPYYGLENYAHTGNPIGFRRYGVSSNPQGIWLRYQLSGAQNTALSDAEFLLVIKLKIIQNMNNGSNASIHNLIQLFFPGRQIVMSDTHALTLAYFVTNNIPLTNTILAAYLPRPLGIGITVTRF